MAMRATYGVLFAQSSTAIARPDHFNTAFFRFVDQPITGVRAGTKWIVRPRSESFCRG